MPPPSRIGRFRASSVPKESPAIKNGVQSRAQSVILLVVVALGIFEFLPDRHVALIILTPMFVTLNTVESEASLFPLSVKGIVG